MSQRPIFCPAGFGMGVMLDVDAKTGDAKYLLFIGDNDRWVAADFEGPAGAQKPAHIYYGRVDRSGGTVKLVQEKVEKFDPDKHKSVCSDLQLSKVDPNKTAQLS